MFKKSLKIATTFGMLVAAYAVYVHSFAFVVGIFGLGQHVSVRFDRLTSASRKKAEDLAERGFGAGHWAAKPDLQIRLYDAKRGSWIYAEDEERRDKGKQVVLTPFAMIWLSPDGKVLKTVTAQRAVLDLNEPIAMNKPDSAPLRVVHAKLEGDVQMRDDKGTPDRADDLTIAMNYVEYDEAALKIYTESAVEIVDRDMRVDGDDLQIDLRPQPSTPTGRPAGFNGAKDAYLRKHVHIVIHNVGSSGILPGPSTTAQRDGEKTPLDLRCDGVMHILFPEPEGPLRVGPPAPQGPTIAQFDRNVEVLRGRLDKTPDKLNCDHLRLTLVPAQKGAAEPGPEPDKRVVSATVDATTPDAPAPAPDGGGPLTDLALRESHATGHNVRIVSAAQGVTARCNELIYKKSMPEAPDITYLRGDGTRKLIVEKTDVATEGERKGQVTSYTRIQTIDATIEDTGKGNDFLTIRRGPGILETRPGLDKPVEQTARWRDSLIVETVPDDRRKALPKDPPAVLKRITLIENASFSDTPSSTDLTAEDKIYVWLKPKPTPAPPASPTTKTSGTTVVAATTTPTPASGSILSPNSGSFDVEKLLALENVHLTSPGRTVIARVRLRAEFATLAPAPPAPKTPGSAPAPTRTLVAGASDAPAEKKDPSKAEPAAPAPASKPDGPKSEAKADLVYARLLIHPASDEEKAAAAKNNTGVASRGGAGRTEIDTVRLRGGVSYHEDPAEGKERGTNVLGEAVDIDSLGKDLSRFVVFNWNPEAEKGKDKDRATDPGLSEFTLARVDTEEMIILGAKIALDQSLDYASVDGLGSMTQMTERGLFSDKDKTKAIPANSEFAAAKTQDQAKTKPAATKSASTKSAVAARPKKVPMTITFTHAMRFYGRPTRPDSAVARAAFVHKKFTDVEVDSEQWPAARAEFYQNVHVDMEDSLVDCADHMMVYLDRPVSLARPASDLSSAAPAPAPKADDPNRPSSSSDAGKADIALVECVEKVHVMNQKFDPTSPGSAGKRVVQEKQDIEGEYLVYDKVSGKFRVPDSGMVFLYQREGQGSTPSDPGVRGVSRPERMAVVDEPRTIRRTAAQNDPPPVVGRNTVGSRVTTDLSANRTRPNLSAKAKSKAAARPLLPPLVLTQIKFARGMIGRFGSGKDGDKTETREADFFRDVESIHARVATADSRLNMDSPPEDYQSLSSQIMHVISEPVLGKPDAQPRYFLTAWEEANARTNQKAIKADRITYDSLKDLFYAYADDGHYVMITEQQMAGISPSQNRSRTVRYNHKTGELDITDPQSFLLFDPKTGVRPTPQPYDPTIKPPIRKKRPFTNSRMNIERKDFNGGNN